MKKLMIAAAIVCAAAMSQAVVVNWGSSAQIKCGTVVQSGAEVKLWLVNYDGNGNDLQIDSRTTTSAGAAANKGKLGGGTGAMQDPFVFGENTVGDVVFQITSASQVYATIVSLDGQYTQQTANMTLSDLTQTQMHTGTFTFGSTIGESGTGVWVAVPEPTSGLLLLLGVAGLALKRRRA